MRAKFPAISFQPLERRTLFAGVPLYVTETTTDFGRELAIDGSRGDDRISVVATDAGLVIANKGGWSAVVPDHFALLRVNAARGNDTVIIDGSVTTDAIVHGSNGDDTLLGGAGDDRLYGGLGRDRILGGAGDDTIVTIGDSASERVTGGDGHDGFWTDAARAELITDASREELEAGAVHRVPTFMTLSAIRFGHTMPAKSMDGMQLRELVGQDVLDPHTGVTYTTYQSFRGLPLFSQAGPAETDVEQGLIGDCYLLAPLMTVARLDPDRIRQAVTELGDGTFAVRFIRDAQEVYVRVDADLPTWTDPTTPLYAALGAQRSMWVAVMEKAYTFFRKGEGTYNSIHAGWMTEGFEVLGLTPRQLDAGVVKAADVLARIRDELAAGAAVTWATSTVPNGIPLIDGHAYAVVSVELDVNGNRMALRLRNPWAIDGIGSDGFDDGYVTLTAEQARAAYVAVVSASV